jgi:hypothetical protein
MAETIEIQPKGAGDRFRGDALAFFLAADFAVLHTQEIAGGIVEMEIGLSGLGVQAVEGDRRLRAVEDPGDPFHGFPRTQRHIDLRRQHAVEHGFEIAVERRLVRFGREGAGQHRGQPALPVFLNRRTEDAGVTERDDIQAVQPVERFGEFVAFPDLRFELRQQILIVQPFRGPADHAAGAGDNRRLYAEFTCGLEETHSMSVEAAQSTQSKGDFVRSCRHSPYLYRFRCAMHHTRTEGPESCIMLE